MNSLNTNRILFFAGMGIGNLVNFADFIKQYPRMILTIHDRHPYLMEFIDYFFDNPAYYNDTIQDFYKEFDMCIMPPITQRRQDIRLMKEMKPAHRIGLVLDERPKFRKRFNHVIAINHGINERETCKLLTDYVHRNFTIL